MKVLFAVALLSLSTPQTQTAPQNPSGLEIVQFDFREKMVEANDFPRSMVSNWPPVIKPDPNVKPTGASQTSDESIDRFAKSLPGPPVRRIKVYSFQTQMKNDSSRPVASFVWAYRLPQSSMDVQDAPDQEFLCNVRIEPGETKRIKVISPIPRPRVVNASASGAPPAPQKPSLQDMIINQARFADGTTWQRSDWNAILLTRVGARKLKNGKCLAL